MTDPLTTITVISAGLKLIEQFREVALRLMGEEDSEPSVTVDTQPLPEAAARRTQSAPVQLEIKRNGVVSEVIRAEDLRMAAWDQQRYETLRFVVGTLFEQFNALEAESTLASPLEEIKIKQRMELLKGRLCPKFREMLELYEATLGVPLADHFSLRRVCGSC